MTALNGFTPVILPPGLLRLANLDNLGKDAFCCTAYVRSWHFCDIARSPMDFRFRWKSVYRPFAVQGVILRSAGTELRKPVFSDMPVSARAKSTPPPRKCSPPC